MKGKGCSCPKTSFHRKMESNLSVLLNVKNQLNSIAPSDTICSDALLCINNMIEKKYLERHNHSIMHLEKEGYYKTRVDLPGGETKTYKQIKCKTLNGLKKKLVEYYRMMENRPTIGKIFQEWLEDRVRHNEIMLATKDRFETDFKRYFVNTGFSEKCIAELSERELSGWIKDTIADNHLSKKAWGNIRSIISGVFKYAKELELTKISISHFLEDLRLPDRMFSHTRKMPEEEVFTDEELAEIVRWILDKDHPDRFQSLSNLGILLCIFTGLRSGELSSIKASDIQGNQLSISRAQTRYKDSSGGYVYEVIEQTKGKAGTRNVTVPDAAFRIIQQIQKINPNCEYLFTGERTHLRMKADAFSDKLARICEYLGLRVKRLHKIRKTYASMLLDAHVPDSLVTSQMGHTDITTTRSFYYRDRHSKDEKKEAITEALSSAISLVS